MIYEYKGNDYKFLFDSFDVKTQTPNAVYMQLLTGHVFNRPLNEFHEKFICVIENAQENIEPKEKSSD